jgi:transposase
LHPDSGALVFATIRARALDGEGIVQSDGIIRLHNAQDLFISTEVASRSPEMEALMSDLFLLSATQMARISPYFPLSHGLQWKDAPGEYGPAKTLHNRFIRWNRLGIFGRLFAAFAGKGSKPERIMIDSTHLKAHRDSRRLLSQSMRPEPKGSLTTIDCSSLRRTPGGMPRFSRGERSTSSHEVQRLNSIGLMRTYQ